MTVKNFTTIQLPWLQAPDKSWHKLRLVFDKNGVSVYDGIFLWLIGADWEEDMWMIPPTDTSAGAVYGTEEDR